MGCILYLAALLGIMATTAYSRVVVAVLPPVGTGLTDLELRLITEQIRTGVSRDTLLTVLSDTEMQSGLHGADSLLPCMARRCAIETGRVLSADKVIISRIIRNDQQCVIHAWFCDVSSGSFQATSHQVCGPQIGDILGTACPAVVHDLDPATRAPPSVSAGSRGVTEERTWFVGMSNVNHDFTRGFTVGSFSFPQERNSEDIQYSSGVQMRGTYWGSRNGKHAFTTNIHAVAQVRFGDEYSHFRGMTGLGIGFLVVMPAGVAPFVSWMTGVELFYREIGIMPQYYLAGVPGLSGTVSVFTIVITF